MFTGIVEEVGEIVEVRDAEDFRVVRIRARIVLEDLVPGSSVSVSGVCITARSIGQDSFLADLSHETLQRTTFRHVHAATPVNLERSMKADSRFGGHIVQGHVDGVGRIRRFDRLGDNWNLEIEFDRTLAPYIVEKGSIAVDGISLTVVKTAEDGFSSAIIPHTLENTILKYAKPSDKVNLELDVIAKYLEKLVRPYLFRLNSGITEEYLKERGF